MLLLPYSLREEECLYVLHTLSRAYGETIPNGHAHILPPPVYVCRCGPLDNVPCRQFSVCASLSDMDHLRKIETEPPKLLFLTDSYNLLSWQPTVVGSTPSLLSGLTRLKGICSYTHPLTPLHTPSHPLTPLHTPSHPLTLFNIILFHLQSLTFPWVVV